jgi:hypothetical protein
MNVWQKRKCHNYKTFTLPRCRKKEAAKLVSEAIEASLVPAERSECMMNEADIEAAVGSASGRQF